MSGARNQDTWMNSARDQDAGMGNRQRCEVNGSREMSDRKLLEDAAKAAGYQHKWNLDGLLIDATCGRWNPLTDDGDALRLAVKLDIEIYQGDDDGPSIYAGYWGKPERRDVTRMFCIELLAPDPYAATRRAIVRAAAAIGAAK